ncbi:MAG: D-alanyl-D-alanine carboxypeptidase family protein [Ruminococcus sp.]|nr:D-alanyl-D-alanine carboxypeptidase family protein [Ruminococcus sp.]
MRKLISILCVMVMSLQYPLIVYAQENQEQIVVTESPSVLLMELNTGTVVFEKNAQEVRSPASITKIMTLLLIFEALENGNLTLDEEVTTSAHAKSMGGSQVYLEEGEKQTVETLIKCIVVSSGNDASVAMAEHIMGNEVSFVAKMNEKAKQLGMKNTNFEDCCGLTDSSNHYTTAEDVAIMSRELVTKHPDILNYSSIWMDTITHVTNKGSEEFGLSNTNKLLRTYPGCVGLKTGSTSVAKFCVSALAKQGDLTMLAVVMGADTPTIRSQDATALLNYGFAACTMYVDDHDEILMQTEVSGGNKENIQGNTKGPFYYLGVGDVDLNRITRTISYKENLEAPIEKGDMIGTITYTLEDKKIGEVEIVSSEDVDKATYWELLNRTLELWGI